MPDNTPTLDAVQNYWDANPAGYAEVKHLAADRLAFFDDRDRQTRALYPRLDSQYNFARARGKLTLELGCGMGYNAQCLAGHGARLVVMDLAPHAVRLTRERFTLRSLPAGFLIADAEHLPFAPGAFQCIFSSGVIHHSPSTPAAAREIVRALAPGGHATVMIYHRDSIWFWWNTVIVLGGLMWILNTLSAAARQPLLNRRPRWAHYPLPPGRPLRLADVFRAGTDFGGLQNPLSRVYTRRAARALFPGLTGFDFTTANAGYRPFDPHPSPLTRLLRRLADWIGDHWGWFLIVHARKP